MAKSRRNVSRKNRSRKNRSRRNLKGGRGLFATVYSPVGQVLGAAGNVVGAVTNTTRNVLKRGLSGVNKVGLSVTNRADSAVRQLVSRKRRANRR